MTHAFRCLSPQCSTTSADSSSTRIARGKRRCDVTQHIILCERASCADRIRPSLLKMFFTRTLDCESAGRPHLSAFYQRLCRLCRLFLQFRRWCIFHLQQPQAATNPNKPCAVRNTTRETASHGRTEDSAAMQSRKEDVVQYLI